MTTTIEYKGKQYTEANINDMRDWLKDLIFADDVDIDLLTAMQVIKGVDRHCDGGINGFDLN